MSEATVKRWADAGTLRCFRTPGGHRKFRMPDVTDFLREHHYETAGAIGPAAVDAASTPGDDDTPSAAHDLAAFEPPREAAETAITFRNLALAGDVDGLVSLIAQQRLRGQKLASIFDHVASPALIDIGERWARGVLTITQEHIASSTVIDALARTRPLIERPTGVDRGRALFACPGDELHDIALRMASLLAHGAGYNVKLVGSRTPASDLALVITAERPRLVVISASQNVVADALEQDLRAIAEASRAVGTLLLVAGRGFDKIAELPHGARRVGSLIEIARVLSEPRAA